MKQLSLLPCMPSRFSYLRLSPTSSVGRCRSSSRSSAAILNSSHTAIISASAAPTVAMQAAFVSSSTTYPGESHLQSHSMPSRRQARQLEQQYGPLWRYVAPSASVKPLTKHLTTTTSSTTQNSWQQHDHVVYSGDSAAPSSSNRSSTNASSIRERAIEVGLVPPQAMQRGGWHQHQQHIGASVHVEASATQPSQEPPHLPASSSTPARQTPFSEPLLQFLEKNEEDAAVLLAMWTSLRRSCLYASDISESLALRVRYFIHSLIHRRAIAAAFELYERLAYIGVQLRRSDLLLLFSNLPYEHSARSSASAEEWIREETKFSKDRRRQKQREDEWQAEKKKTMARGRAAAASLHKTATSTGVSKEEKLGQGMIKMGQGGAAAEVYSPSLAQVQVAAAVHVEPHQSIADQPEWVKRWVLYEASMGNLDLYEDEPAPSFASALESAAVASTSADTLATATSATEGKDTAAEKIAATWVSTNRLLDVAAALEHLGVMQASVSEKQQWVEEASRGEVSSATSALKKKSSSSSIRLRRAKRGHSAVVEQQQQRRYATEAVHVLKRFLAEESADEEKMKETDEPDSTSARRTLPAALADSMYALVRRADSWPVALTYLKLLHAHCYTLSSRDAVLFMRLATFSSAESASFNEGIAFGETTVKPWERDRAVEELMAEYVMPALPCDNAASYAAQSLWSSHLCVVKVDRPDAFPIMLERAQAMWGTLADASKQERDTYNEKDCMGASRNTKETAGVEDDEVSSGSMSALMQYSAAAAQLATTHLLVEVKRHGNRMRARRVVAASVQSGAFVPSEAQEQQQKVQNEDQNFSSSDSTALSILSSTLHSLDTQTLTPELLDTFLLCRASTLGAITLNALSATRSDAAVVGLHTLVEKTVYGPFGLWTAFARVYLAQDFPGGTQRQRGSTTYKSSSTSSSSAEKPYVAASMTCFLVRVASLLCSAAASSSNDGSRFGSGRRALAPAQLQLMLELAATALEHTDTSGSGSLAAEWNLRVSLCLEELRPAVAHLLRSATAYLTINPEDERVVFGALQQDAVQCLVALGKLLSRLDPTPSMRTGKTVMALVPPSARKAVGVCFSSLSALGRRVRMNLNSRETARIDAHLVPVQSSRSNGTNIRGGTTHLKRRSRHIAAPVNGAFCSRNPRFNAALVLRQQAYAALLAGSSSGNVAPVSRTVAPVTTSEHALMEVLDHTRGEDSLILSELLTRDLQAAPNTVSTRFFAKVLGNLALGLEAEARSHSQSRTETTPHSGKPSPLRSNLWQDAIGVFWSAVDHTGPGSTAEGGPSSAVGIANDNNGRKTSRGEMSMAAKHERAVLTELLHPLLRVSMAAERADLGRRWRRVWASAFTSEERADKRWARINVQALAILNDQAALAQSVQLARDAGIGTNESSPPPRRQSTESKIEAATNDGASAAPSPPSRTQPTEEEQALVCSIAATHNNWLSALNAMFEVCGDAETHQASGTAYPLPVVHTLLRILGKSRTNLSNTALRLKTLQQQQRSGHGAWDVESTLLLARLLIRARRWMLAFQQVQDALATPEVSAVASVYSQPGAATPRIPIHQAAVDYAALLTVGLQACAIGGASEEATELYDSLKLMVLYYKEKDTTAEATCESKAGNRNGSAADDVLDIVLSVSPASLTPARDVDENRGNDSTDAASLSPEEKALHKEVGELSVQARSYFLRAMTKKMMSGKNIV